MHNFLAPKSRESRKGGLLQEARDPTLGASVLVGDDTTLAPAAFPVVADAQSIFLLDRLRSTVHELLLGIRTRRGFLLLSGEVGLGKTTISRHIMQILEGEGTAFSLVFNTLIDGKELLEAINHDFGIEESAASMQGNIRLLNAFLLEQYRLGRNCVIIVDDAQNLADSALELIRMLSNLETNNDKLLQILLVGQPELSARLNRPELRQLRSRIAVNTTLQPFSRDETRRYLEFRMLTAWDGGKTTLTEAARYAVHRLTVGVPRRINILMERCLRLAAQRQTAVIDDVIVNDAAAALGMVFPNRITRWLRILGARRPGRSVAAAFGVMAFLLLGMGLVVFDRSPNRAAQSDAIKSEPTAQESVPAAQSTPETTTTAGTSAASDLPHASVMALLEEHGLTREAERMQEAIRTNTLSQLDARFAREHGLRIIILDGVAASFWPSEQRIHVNPDNTPPRFIALWRPNWWVGELRTGMRSDAIRQLQEHLIRTGHYPERADGISGPMTIQAIRDFQRAAGINVSGRADALTQFLLQQQ